MTATALHRLDGLEPDNLLAFLALLGLLKALEAVDREGTKARKILPRALWDVDSPPLRPVLAVDVQATREEIVEAAARGIDLLASTYEFGGRKDLNYTTEETRDILTKSAGDAAVDSRDHIDVLAALMTDGALKDEKDRVIRPTPLCLLFGQGHQHFLDRLARVPQEPAPPPRGRGKSKRVITGAECLAEALFQPWHRSDHTLSFRWDPEEDVRYALMAGDPTDTAYKAGTQHGANRLASLGLAALTVVPVTHGAQTQVDVLGGEFKGGFSFAWPIWRDPASLAAIRALLGHPGLRDPGALDHLGVEHVLLARRISVGKFMNFTRARPLSTEGRVQGGSGAES